MTQEIKNMLDVIFKLGDYVNTYWTFYAVLNIAVVGWVISSPMEWNWEKKLFMTVGYGLIVSVNFFGQYRATRLIRIGIDELKAMITATGDAIRTEELKNEVMKFRYVDRTLIITIHLIMDVIVIACIWLRGTF